MDTYCDFFMVVGIIVVRKTGWLKLEGLEDTAGMRLFAAVALGGICWECS